MSNILSFLRLLMVKSDILRLFPAPFVFTKVVKVLIKHRRCSGIIIFGFIDDVFGGGRTYMKLEKFQIK